MAHFLKGKLMLQKRAAQLCLAVAALAFLLVGIGHVVVPLTMVRARSYGCCWWEKVRLLELPGYYYG